MELKDKICYLFVTCFGNLQGEGIYKEKGMHPPPLWNCWMPQAGLLSQPWHYHLPGGGI